VKRSSGGFLGNVIEFKRSVIDGAQAPEAKVDRGGGDAVTAGHFAPSGDDSPPLPGDVGFLSASEGAGNAQLLGYQDPETVPRAAAGEKRIYARSGPGISACEIWLKADGTIEIENDAGSVEITPEGNLVLSNDLGSIEVDALGDITFSTPLGTFGAATHMHSTPFGPSGPPIPNT
jgi:hypothetical protein